MISDEFRGSGWTKVPDLNEPSGFRWTLAEDRTPRIGASGHPIVTTPEQAREMAACLKARRAARTAKHAERTPAQVAEVQRQQARQVALGRDA